MYTFQPAPFQFAAGGQPAAVLNMVGFNSKLVSYCATLAQARTMIQGWKIN